jgi:Raf kinase inhibitor-like YbhB/YbcL family protein
MGMKISSSAFNDGAAIPAKYTCDGENISPPLTWSGLPDGTQSLALIVDDPDAPGGTWVHWVIYNLPPDMNGLTQNVPVDAVLHDHGRQGSNDFRKHGYGGPCPPNGTHRYFFKLYALDAMLPLEGDVTKERLLQAMTHHILTEVELVGTYERAK